MINNFLRESTSEKTRLLILRVLTGIFTKCDLFLYLLIFLRSPWAQTVEDELRHKKGQQLMGESLRGKDKRIIPLLYTITFFGVSEAEMEAANLNKEDVRVIKRAQDHMGLIYRRFIKQCYGWKVATGSVFGHIYGLSVLRGNVKLGFCL